MEQLLKSLREKGIKMPDEIADLLTTCKKATVFSTTQGLADASTGGRERDLFEVKYTDPVNGEYTEVIVHRVENGISANYTEP